MCHLFGVLLLILFFYLSVGRGCYRRRFLVYSHGVFYTPVRSGCFFRSSYRSFLHFVEAFDYSVSQFHSLDLPFSEGSYIVVVQFLYNSDTPYPQGMGSEGGTLVYLYDILSIHVSECIPFY